MRNNLPVIDKEFRFPEDASLVSSTDLQGRIVHCNEAFVQVSGYTRDELLGQPHNLIRHPDMPAEAFADMWRTIAAGAPWTGVVKNRRKDGSFYWVLANVTPLMRGAGPIGYLSVRTTPSRDAVAEAQRLYAQMRESAAAGHPSVVLREGMPIRTGAAPRLAAAIRAAFPTPLAAGAAALAAAGWIGHALGGAAGLAVPVAGVVVAAWLARRAGRGRMLAVVAPANRMAAGDLSAYRGSDEGGMPPSIARAFGQVKVNLRAIVGDARREIENMRIATQEITSGNTDLAARTEAQAASVQQTAATMEQITGAVRQSAEAARQAAQLAAQANVLTRESNDSVVEMTRAMREIADSSARIGEFIQVIDSVAFQTNILALNAAVEAARAGEQGRGFAVVATEVRALARRTTEAALEAKTLIERAAMIVEEGNRVSETAHRKIHEAARGVEGVNAMIDEISAGAGEQLLGISQVNEAVSNLDTLTQHNAALVEQIAAAAMALEDQASSVADAMSVFHMDDTAALGPDAVALRRAAKVRARARVAD